MPRPLTRDALLITAVLVALSAAAWGYTLHQTGSISSSMDMDADLTMGMDAPIFIAMWLAMMAAMMFPTTMPMVLTFATICRGRRRRGSPYTPTWVFLAGYFVIWAATAGPAYLAAWAVDRLADRFSGLPDYGPLTGGLILIAAGIYQLSPLKNFCLRQCRSPLGFIMTYWREGYRGTFAMGLRHGTFCLGCCWVLFIIFFAVGVMNLAWMGALAALVFLEKVSRHGVAIGYLAAVLLLGAGALMLVDADLLLGV